MGCWVIEVTCRFRTEAYMVTKGRERREQRRLIEEQEKAKNQDEDGSKLKVQ